MHLKEVFLSQGVPGILTGQRSTFLPVLGALMEALSVVLKHRSLVSLHKDGDI